MKKLFLAGAMLVWSGAAFAQDSQCSSVEQGAPDIERVDVSTIERTSDNSAVVQLDVVATTPNGAQPTYSFNGGGNPLANEGPRATWAVEGEGPFTATIEVRTPGSDCVSHADVTFTVEEPAVS
jgi:hypothetical protein